jgi:hypothetical protein
MKANTNPYVRCFSYDKLIKRNYEGYIIIYYSFAV